MKLKLNITLDDLEMRAATPLNSDKEYFEIVKWTTTTTRHCYTLAVFDQDKEGYNLRFIGNRPFDDKIRSTDFWAITKMAQAILDLFWSRNHDD
jgi:hypothetical protein